MKTAVVLSPAPVRPALASLSRIRWRRLLPLVTVMPAIALVLSGLITRLNLGGGPGFLARWMQAFATALPVMPLGMLTLVGLDRVLGPRLATWPRVPATVLLAVCTAGVMELLLSCVVTLSNHGLGAGFPAQWAAAFVRSLPAGFAIGLLMGFVIKPRLARSMAAA
ncbi:MAG: DUF2798 domain-containing protein [Hydrogenophaga sp.]|uniref:DUF2798 domain-containing protein n=1 Tax=Hydrogenophaga sp. TaxID=1904254 RepID=UPI003D9BB7F3